MEGGTSDKYTASDAANSAPADSRDNSLGRGQSPAQLIRNSARPPLNCEKEELAGASSQDTDRILGSLPDPRVCNSGNL